MAPVMIAKPPDLAARRPSWASKSAKASGEPRCLQISPLDGYLLPSLGLKCERPDLECGSQWHPRSALALKAAGRARPPLELACQRDAALALPCLVSINTDNNSPPPLSPPANAQPPQAARPKQERLDGICICKILSLEFEFQPPNWSRASPQSLASRCFNFCHLPNAASQSDCPRSGWPLVAPSEVEAASRVPAESAGPVESRGPNWFELEGYS